MPLLFGALGVLELIFLSVFFLLLVVGASFDRRGNESLKWYVFVIGFVGIAIYYWNEFTLSSIWDAVSTMEFWKPIGAYFLAGLVYSILEFALEVRRAARYYKDAWASKLDEKCYPQEKAPGLVTVRELMAARDTEEYVSAADNILNRFVINHRSTGFVRLTISADRLPEPLINKRILASSIGAWMFFWPAYAISLIIGDLLTEVFNILSDLFVKISGRFVRLSFADVFKLN